MKFLLIMQVCSAMTMSCMDPMDAGEYKTHFDCATAGYLNAIGLNKVAGKPFTKTELYKQIKKTIKEII